MSGMKILTFLSFIASSAFLVLAVRGSTNWFAGFIFFFYLGLELFGKRKFSIKIDSLRERLFVYLLSLIFFLIIDAVLGLRVYQYWEYRYYILPSNWVILYIISYPFVGLALSRLLQLLNWRKGTIAILDSFLVRKLVLMMFSIIYIVILGLVDVRNNIVIEWSSFILLFLLWCLIFGDYILKRFKNPARQFLLLFVASALIGFIAEFVNTYSWEWEYINLPVKIAIANIPIFVLGFWFLLATPIILEDMVNQALRRNQA